MSAFILVIVAAIIANAASYFLLSDGYGVQKWNDGLIRIGFPFLMYERGGFDFRDKFYADAAAKNLGVAIGVALLGAVIFRAIRKDESET